MNIFEIENKENTPEMLAFANGKPTKNFEFAEEFNTMTENAIQNSIDNLQMDLYWQNSPEMVRRFERGGTKPANPSTELESNIPAQEAPRSSFELEKQPIGNVGNIVASPEIPFTGKVQLLGVHINNAGDLFSRAETIILMIDRYRPKRLINLEGFTRPSGYKHFKQNDLNGRLNEIELIQTNSIIDFGQEYHFNVKTKGIKTTGAGYRYQTYNRQKATDFLRFRLVVTINGKVYESKPLGHLKMLIVKKNQFQEVYNISYKRP